MKKQSIILISMLIVGSAADAQQGFIATGSDVTNASGSISYSVGQPVFQAVNNASGLIIEGLQQPPIPGDPLPITLLYFKAIANENRTVTLQWTTVSEINAAYFTVERSKNAIHFSSLTDVDAKGNTNTKESYSIFDLSPYDDDSYYRLKEMDRDGKITYSTIQKVHFDDAAFSIVAAPNPVENYLQIMIGGMETEGLHYRLIDVTGRQLHEGIVTGSTTTVDISSMAAASYILQVTDGRQVLTSFKIIKR